MSTFQKRYTQISRCDDKQNRHIAGMIKQSGYVVLITSKTQKQAIVTYDLYIVIL